MKLPTCLWMLGVGVFLSVASAHAQRIEDIIELNAEFNENGDLVVTADKNGSALIPLQSNLSTQPIWLYPHVIGQRYVPAVL